jgi:RHS repeat-associated protein
VTTLKETVGYVYDYQNRLVKRNDEFLVHDEWQIICSLKNNKVSHYYLWGANQDELIVADENWTLGDHLNSIRDVIDARGKVTGHREYNAFGKVTRATGKAECVFGYTGKMFDNQTQLQWNINRWYDANVGRWVSEDPIGFRGSDWNLLRYCHNSPLYNLDSLGLVLDYIYNHGIQSGTTLTFTWLNLQNQTTDTFPPQGMTIGPKGIYQNNGYQVWNPGISIFEFQSLCAKEQQTDCKWKVKFIIKWICGYFDTSPLPSRLCSIS